MTFENSCLLSSAFSSWSSIKAERSKILRRGKTTHPQSGQCCQIFPFKKQRFLRRDLRTQSYCAWKGSKSHSFVPDSLQPHGLCSPLNSPGQNTGGGSLSLLQGIFPTQGSNPGLLNCRFFTSWAITEAKVHSKGMTSRSHGSYIFPYTEKH